MITKYTIPHFFYQWAAVFLLLFLGGFMLCQAQTRSFTIGDVTFTMNFVEGGTFNMGAQNTNNTLPGYEAGADFNENPVHAVTVADFYMAPYLITQELWETLLYETPNAEFEQQWFEGAGLGNQYPAYYITYNDVQRFITALNDFCHYTQQLSDDEFFRLPTEAEWEYAARGGKQSQGYVYAGSNTASEVAWYVENSPESTQKVGLKKPNELGLYDMSGNVMEWCSDLYGNYTANSQTNPTGPANGTYRVLRGGVYMRPATLCRIAARSYAFDNTRVSYYGARLALIANPPTGVNTLQTDKPTGYIQGTQLHIVNLSGTTQIALYNILGQKVAAYHIASTTHNINMLSFPKGMYILRLNQTTQRIVW